MVPASNRWSTRDITNESVSVEVPVSPNVAKLFCVVSPTARTNPLEMAFKKT
jgi:hypothetical protein